MSSLDKLPSNEPVTGSAPPSALEVEIASKSKQASQKAEMALRQTSQRAPSIPLLDRKPATVEPPPPPKPRQATVEVIPKPVKLDPEIVAATNLIVNRICSLSSEWGTKIDAMRTERNLRNDQICFALMAHTLDSGAHMIVPIDHAYFAPNFLPGGSNFNCMQCNEVGTRKYPGQPPLCSNKCADAFRKLPAEDQRELLEAAA